MVTTLYRQDIRGGNLKKKKITFVHKYSYFLFFTLEKNMLSTLVFDSFFKKNCINSVQSKSLIVALVKSRCFFLK